MGRSALLVASHPPGRGSGTGLRAAVSLDALRDCFERVDVVALASPGEDALADPAALLISRPEDPPPAARLAALRYGGSYYAAERQANLAGVLRAHVADGRLLPRYDLLWVCQSLTARAAVGEIDAAWRILDIDNIAGADHRRLAGDRSASTSKRVFRRVAARAVTREERRRCALFNGVVVPSELERERLGPVDTRVVVVPNSVPEGPRIDLGANGPEMLFVGSLDYEPNIDGLRWFVRDVLPRVGGEGRLQVAGRNPSEEVVRLCREGGATLGPNAPDLEPLYASSRVVVAPLRLGGGTRFKILEAMARGAAIVATSTAAEGLEAADGTNIFLANDAATFAARCRELLADPQLAGALGAAACETWKRFYAAGAAKAKIVGLLEDLLTRMPAPESPRSPSPARHG